MATIPDPPAGCKSIETGGGHPARPNTPLRWRALAALVLLVMGGLAVSLALKSPVDVLGSGGCPTRRFAGVYCPGCGTLRATHHLLNGRVAESWRHNPLLILAGVPCAAALACALLAMVVTGRPGRSPNHPSWLLWSVAATLLGWGVLRNIPADALDWTRPPGPTTPPTSQ